MAASEELTAKDIARILAICSPTSWADEGIADDVAIAKILRLYKQQQARIADLESESKALKATFARWLEEGQRLIQIALDAGNRAAELEAEFGRILDYECGVCGRTYRGQEREPCCSRCGSHSKQNEVKITQW